MSKRRIETARMSLLSKHKSYAFYKRIPASGDKKYIHYRVRTCLGLYIRICIHDREMKSTEPLDSASETGSERTQRPAGFVRLRSKAESKVRLHD